MVAPLIREDFVVQGEAGVVLFVREVCAAGPAVQPGVPILLVHGARVPGIASFDLPVPGGSLAADLAEAGHPVYIMDVRGYGGSTRPAAMEREAAGPPLVRSAEVVRDLAVVVEWISERQGGRPIAALGWATGGQWLGHYATLYADSLSHLILDNSLYGTVPDHPSLGRGSSLEDPQHPGQFNQAETPAYRYNTAASLVAGWDASIPLAEKAEWYDPAVVAAYQVAALASDPTSGTRTPPSFRAPTGALEDSFYLATGRQLWDASYLRARTLVLRSERDFWSRPEDPPRLAVHAVHAPVVRQVTLPSATHFVHLDRPERGLDRFLREVLAFLREG
jgi:pimeloyl-ACP methyl ester carboxylesterase